MEVEELKDRSVFRERSADLLLLRDSMVEESDEEFGPLVWTELFLDPSPFQSPLRRRLLPTDVTPPRTFSLG